MPEKCKQNTPRVFGQTPLLSTWMVSHSCTRLIHWTKHAPRKGEYGEKDLKASHRGAWQKALIWNGRKSGQVHCSNKSWQRSACLWKIRKTGWKLFRIFYWPAFQRNVWTIMQRIESTVATRRWSFTKQQSSPWGYGPLPLWTFKNPTAKSRLESDREHIPHCL